MKKRALFVVLSLVAAFGVYGTATAAEWVASRPAQDIAEAAAAVDAYWTPERMKAAMPHPMAISGRPTDVSAAELERAETALPVEATSSKTGRPSQLLTPTAAPQPAGIQPASSSYPFPHTTYKVLRTSYTVFPYRAIGKVFFTKTSGGNYVCSGSSVGGRVVLTAGHCVAEGGARLWHKNWSFIPAYRGWYADAASQRPYGTWTAFQLWTFTDWLNLRKYCRDVGMVVTNNNLGLKLSQKVGSLGFAANQVRSKQHWDAFGYPAAYPWDGREMVQTEAEWARDDNPGCTPYTVGIGTSQTGGCSGGPWVKNFYPSASGANNYANGLFSYYYTNQPNGAYSPYFDAAVFSFWQTVVVK
jgi:V8-like Glu-specific endopeptidase